MAVPAWRQHGSIPVAVAGHASALEAGGTLWIAGGTYWREGKKEIDGTVRRRARGDAEWTSVLTLPGGYAQGGFAGTDDALWLVGGFTTEGVSTAIRRVSFRTAAAEVAAQLPEPRAYCGAALLDGALWIVGGARAEGRFADLPTTCFRYDLARKTLAALPGAGPAFVNPVVLALQGELHVLPGSVWSGERQRLEPPAAIWIYSPARGAWEQRPLAQPLPRGLSGVALDQDRALLAGGVELGDAGAEVSRRSWIYEARAGAFVPFRPLPEPRLAAALVADGSTAWLSGGEGAPRHRAAEIWSLALVR